jgi:hypothetical protein
MHDPQPLALAKRLFAWITWLLITQADVRSISKHRPGMLMITQLAACFKHQFNQFGQPSTRVGAKHHHKPTQTSTA